MAHICENSFKTYLSKPLTGLKGCGWENQVRSLPRKEDCSFHQGLGWQDDSLRPPKWWLLSLPSLR